MTAREITITFDPDQLDRYSDGYLAMLWHVAQANPADGFRTKEPGEIAQKVLWEIARRWLRTVEPEMYVHQQGSYWRHQLSRFARYDYPTDGRPFEEGVWVAHDEKVEQAKLDAAGGAS